MRPYILEVMLSNLADVAVASKLVLLHPFPHVGNEITEEHLRQVPREVLCHEELGLRVTAVLAQMLNSNGTKGYLDLFL